MSAVLQTLSEEAVASARRMFPMPSAESLIRYIDRGVPTGDFLRAVLANDLVQACRMADHANATRLAGYGMWLDRYAPAECYGSHRAVQAWVDAFREGEE